MSRSTELAYWITERERMRVCKEAGEKLGAGSGLRHGWSDDPHMGTVRYCNVRREDDKVTRWLAQHWRPSHHAVWEIVLARMVNYIPTLEAILKHWEFHDGASDATEIELAAWRMKNLRDKGEKIWTSAYTISTCGKSMDKVDYVMGVVQRVRNEWGDSGDFRTHEYRLPTLQEAHTALTKIDGLGSFLAAQVVADLKNTQGHILQQAPDWHTWAAHGPGSLKGLTDYFGHPVTPANFTRALTVCWNETSPMLPHALRDLHMQDFQNCMCEFSKYMRVKRGGHVRNKYAAA